MFARYRAAGDPFPTCQTGDSTIPGVGRLGWATSGTAEPDPCQNPLGRIAPICTFRRLYKTRGAYWQSNSVWATEVVCARCAVLVKSTAIQAVEIRSRWARRERRRITEIIGERGWTRTIDPCLKRALLCQLSYAPTILSIYHTQQTFPLRDQRQEKATV